MKKSIPYIVGGVVGLILGFSFATSMGAGTSKPKPVMALEGSYSGKGAVLFDDGSIWEYMFLDGWNDKPKVEPKP